jgi:hypothetical protein
MALPRLLDNSTLPEFTTRIDNLAEDTPRTFGTLTPHGMVQHMEVMFLLSLGRQHGADLSNFLTRSRPVFWFMVDVMPWPKGKLKAPGYFTPAPEGEFADAKARLKGLMQDFCAALAKSPQRREATPLLGPITMQQWSRLHGRHLRHHFEQFSLA